MADLAMIPVPTADNDNAATEDDTISTISKADSASEEESSDKVAPPVKEVDRPQRTMERCRVDYAQFHQFIWGQQQKENNSFQQGLIAGPRSLAWLNDSGCQKIMSSPREYQRELFERAKEKNIIIVLDTGSGKTLIAGMLLRHIAEQELIDRSNKKEPRISFFLVEKVSLVFQQYKFLKKELDHEVKMLHGDFVGNMRTAEFWKEQFDNSMVIVCTAAILLNCLYHSYIRMEQINLLVFDEAHHAKKNHPYARIIKDFYAPLEADGYRRPRILGMTASPVDAKTDLATAAAQLEGLLHSEIATVSDPKLMKESKLDVKSEELIEYALAPAPFETALWQKLYMLVGQNVMFKKLFIFSKECTRDLGRWCADRVWHLAFTQDEMMKIKAKTERGFMNNSERSISVIDAKTSAVYDAHQIVLNHTLPKAKATYEHVSQKIIALIQVFRQHFKPTQDKCIIFVQQRHTAVLLADLLRQPGMGIEDIKPSALLGTGSGEAGEQLGMSYKNQQAAVSQFKHGDLNCLVATSIAEEGIDIPDCNMIIRFDLYSTMIQYIQSKGRARKRNSKYFHMVELGNQEQTQRVFDNQEKEEMLRLFCQVLPEDRQLRGNDFNMDYFLSKEKFQRSYVVKKTGAKLTYKSSLIVLAAFVASLHHSHEDGIQTDYIVKSVGKEFQCEVVLPDNSPIKSAIGRRASSKQVAKCSAAFEMCLKLREQGELNEYLQSKYKKRRYDMTNALMALDSKKREEYPMRLRPEFWSHRGIPDKLYVTVIKLQSPEALGRPSRPLAMLTRAQLPQIAAFPIFFGNQTSSVVECMSSASVIETSLCDVEKLTGFTLRIFKDIFSKEYKSEPQKVPYYLAPLKIGHDFEFYSSADGRAYIDWECLNAVLAKEQLGWEGEPKDIFADKFVTDPHDGFRKFFTIGVLENLKSTDPQIPSAPKIGGSAGKRARRDGPDDIWNYSVSLWSQSRMRIKVRHDLPVVEAEFIPLRRNLLDEFEKPDEADNRCYLVFETLKLSALPTDVVSMAYLLPGIMHRMDSNLIALEACKEVGLDIRADLALEAMTKNSDSTDEHSEQQVNFQKGMGQNYERLEFLGDCFLKMSTTIALYSQLPANDEGEYHVDRMLLICNKNLLKTARENLKIYEYIRSKSFNRRIWYPDGLELLKGKKNDSILGNKGAGNAGRHILAEKSIADVCEALIGAAYLTTYERKSFDLAVQAVTKFTNNSAPKKENAVHKVMAYDEYYVTLSIPEWQTAEPTAVHLYLANQVEQRVGYKFANPRLVRSAFIHPSYSFMYEQIPHYQRLEFLGDALLDMVCVDFLFHRYPGADPQWLTEHKMAMVSNQFLGCLCVGLGFQKHLVSMAGGLQQEIASYVNAIEAAKEQAETQAESVNLSRAAYARNFWVELEKPPKCLPDIVEACIGAIFVDSKYDYSQVQRFFNKHILPYFEDMHLYDTFANKHPVTFLTNMLQVHFCCGNWRLMVEEVPAAPGAALSETQVICAVMIHGEVREHATAASGRYAKIAAAKRIMETLVDIESVGDFRAKYGCTCMPEEAEKVDPLAYGTAI